ncbi:hypothetical protein MRX96_004806 [Rhipicephalus microplus]
MSLNDEHGVTRDGRKTTTTRFVFTREERELLVNLVMRHKAVIENKRTDALAKRAKDSAWKKLTSEYNSQPGIRRVTVAQLRKLWDNEKFRWKKKQSEEKRNLYATDETIQPQLRSSEGAGSPGPQTTQPPTGGRTPTAEINAKPPTANERVLAPEVAARMEALKTDEQRKAQLHALELRLRGGSASCLRAAQAIVMTAEHSAKFCSPMSKHGKRRFHTPKARSIVFLVRM